MQREEDVKGLGSGVTTRVGGGVVLVVNGVVDKAVVAAAEAVVAAAVVLSGTPAAEVVAPVPAVVVVPSGAGGAGSVGVVVGAGEHRLLPGSLQALGQSKGWFVGPGPVYTRWAGRALLTRL